MVRLLLRHRGDQIATLAFNGGLTMLDLDRCNLKDEGATIAADFLRTNTTARTAFFRGNQIGPLGSMEIAEAMKHNRTLWGLFLKNNQIGKEGADALIEALRHNVVLRLVNVEKNLISKSSENIIRYLTQSRNQILIPSAVRSAALGLIAIRRWSDFDEMGDLAIFPKEIVKMISMQVWATRKDPIWIQALSKSEQMGKLDKSGME